MDLRHLSAFAQLGRLQITLAPVENFGHHPGFRPIQHLSSRTELVQRLVQRNPIQALSLPLSRTPAQACLDTRAKGVETNMIWLQQASVRLHLGCLVHCDHGSRPFTLGLGLPGLQ